MAQEKQKGNQPEKKFRAGGVTATVWKNTGKDKSGKENEYKTVSVERSYLDGEDWKKTNSMRQNDLPKLALVSNLAYEYIVLKEEE